MAAVLPFSTNGPSQDHASFQKARSRSMLVKALRRYLLTCLNRFKSLNPLRKVLVGIIGVVVLLFSLYHVILALVLWLDSLYSSSGSVLYGLAREQMHFKRRTHFVLPPARSLSRSDMSPCSWAYIEVNAGDGRDLAGFFTNANGHFEESIRAELAAAHAFCVAAFDPNESNAPSLFAIRADKARYTRRFHVFPGVAVPFTPTSGDPDKSTSHLNLPDLVRKLTYPLHEAGVKDVRTMSLAKANGQEGNVFVRISGTVVELVSYLKLLDNSKVLCDRIDRLVLNVTTSLQKERFSAESIGGIPDPDIGIASLRSYATAVERRASCRAKVFVLDEYRRLIAPDILDQNAIFYAILAGAPTFNERIRAQTNSWMKGVPTDRIAIYTNEHREGSDLEAAGGRNVFVVQPQRPELERKLSRMQSWSHLVRLRESWDRFMHNDTSIKWLALVDDDTFVFPAGMREYLTMFNSEIPMWGGSGEQARIDNGDHGEFAYWLRNLSTAHGSSRCYLVNEEIPNSVKMSQMLQTKRHRRNHRVPKSQSLMCHDTFCRRGCPAVPQGAAIVVSRALVKSLRPVVEKCEQATASLCDRCGSQRLYMCVNRFVQHSKTLMMRGICRSPWKVEHRDNFPIALTFHAFGRFGSMGLSTTSMHDDMQQLWELGSQYELHEPWHRTVPMQEVANLLHCGGKGRYVKGSQNCESFSKPET